MQLYVSYYEGVFCFKGEQLPLIITQAQENLALNNAKSASGTYVLITYFMIDVKSGKRTYLLKTDKSPRTSNY